MLTKGAKAQYALGSMFIISNEHVYDGDKENVNISENVNVSILEENNEY